MFSDGHPKIIVLMYFCSIEANQNGQYKMEAEEGVFPENMTIL